MVQGNLRGDSAVMYAYGIYLANGGTRDGFMDLTYADIQIMLIAYTGTKKKDMMDQSKMISTMFGGNQNE